MILASRGLSRPKSFKFYSLIAPIWAYSVDVFLTIFYQPTEYWQGNLSAANEGNPIGSSMMGQSTSGIFVICFIWLVCIIGLGLMLPRKYARVFLLFVVIAHSWGAGTWIDHRFGYWSVILLIFLNAILFTAIEDWRNKKESSSGHKLAAY